MKKSLFIVSLCTFFTLTSYAQDVWLTGDHDSLIIFNGNAEVSTKIGNLSVQQTIGNYNAIKVSSDGSYAWMNTNADYKLRKISSSGEILLEIADRKYGAIDYNGGNIYVLRDNGLISGDSIFVLNPEGQVIRKAQYGGFDITVNEADSAIWTIGSTLRKLDLNLNLKFERDFIQWAASSITKGDNGDVWVGVANYPGMTQKNSIYQVTGNGDTIKRAELTGRPYCIRYDNLNKNLWIASPNGTFKYDTKTSTLSQVFAGYCYSLDIDHISGHVWVTGTNFLKKLDLDGNVLINKALVADNIRYIAVKKELTTAILPEQKNQTSTIRIYPNPTSDIINIEGLSSSNQVAVFDLSGKQLWSQKNCGTQINLDCLPQGIFTLRIIDNNREESRKIIRK